MTIVIVDFKKQTSFLRYVNAAFIMRKCIEIDNLSLARHSMSNSVSWLVGQAFGWSDKL